MHDENVKFVLWELLSLLFIVRHCEYYITFQFILRDKYFNITPDPPDTIQYCVDLDLVLEDTLQGLYLHVFHDCIWST